MTNDLTVDDDFYIQFEDSDIERAKNEQVDKIGKIVTFCGQPRELLQEEYGAYRQDDLRRRPVGTQLAESNSSAVATSYSYDVYDTVD